MRWYMHVPHTLNVKVWQETGLHQNEIQVRYIAR